MRVLALDPGFGRLGVAVLDKGARGRDAVVYSDCFETSSKDTFVERLHAVGAECVRLIAVYKPDVFATETLLFSKNQKTALMVSETRGVLLYEARRAHLPIYEYNPMQIKAAVTGYGKATKQDVETMVMRLVSTPTPIKLDDEADAIAIAITCLAIEVH